jgi:hypothetical protein
MNNVQFKISCIYHTIELQNSKTFMQELKKTYSK